MQYNQFRTHKGDVVTGERLQRACDAVAKWYEDNAKACREGVDYPPHVTQATKNDIADRRLEWAGQVRRRENLNNFSVWQRVNAELTGESIAFLPKN